MKAFNAEFFAHRLKLKKKVFNLSIREAAKQIGISPATLSRLNREKFVPDVNTFYLCCKWLSVDMKFFFLKK